MDAGTTAALGRYLSYIKNDSVLTKPVCKPGRGEASRSSVDKMSKKVSCTSVTERCSSCSPQ
ncbi:hypothetical protein E2C01_015749 [Portunus trituberculatus]|uniref:Uncharacterized protein n=1 Tax=Portunus trituberculatus TaxID=210409 RepID=A0A5B7DNU7_PORTR|nr:hypothetical protein [Portunus trituberculatus]